MVDVKYGNLLESTFLHLKGINESMEKRLWESGITNLEQLKKYYYSPQLFDDIYGPIDETVAALDRNDIDYFIDRLPAKELYRVAVSSYKDVMFLDIETTGLSKVYSYITMIGWILDGQYKYVIKGQSPDLLLADLAKSKMLVTFNGSKFDIPFIKKELPHVKIPEAHIDLMYFTRRFGYSGGQKEIEKQLKVFRPETVNDLNGKEAISLWYRYLAGDLASLQSLITYNYYDVIGMQQIFDLILAKHIDLPISKDYLYKFSHEKANLEVCVSQDTYKKTKSQIKDYAYHELFPQINEKIKVIGIDLTGSEKKASGCCLLNGNHADTFMMKSDEEIIDFVLDNRPILVSIDSPLSLPKGRKKVTDDDEGRGTYGIMRWCERELKRRGVNVYPCLISSMQQLTARGIRLANILRSKGIPVIESFPGAAQDVLRIPRKKTDLYFLKKGLLDFGIDMNEGSISHDELDAITSALVGVFFWYGKFEALGNDDEEYLIIPELNGETHWGKRKIVGISGPIATGKTTAAQVLRDKGYAYYRFSQLLEDMLIEDNKEVNRQNLQELGNKVNSEWGQYWLCKKLSNIIPETGNVVIDGLRHPEDYAFFTERYGRDFLHVFIDTPENKRRNRYLNRPSTLEEYLKAKNHPVERNVSLMKRLAHLVIKNDLSKSSFEKRIMKTVETYYK